MAMLICKAVLRWVCCVCYAWLKHKHYERLSNVQKSSWVMAMLICTTVVQARLKKKHCEQLCDIEKSGGVGAKLAAHEGSDFTNCDHMVMVVHPNRGKFQSTNTVHVPHPRIYKCCTFFSTATHLWMWYMCLHQHLYKWCTSFFSIHTSTNTVNVLHQYTYILYMEYIHTIQTLCMYYLHTSISSVHVLHPHIYIHGTWCPHSYKHCTCTTSTNLPTLCMCSCTSISNVHVLQPHIYKHGACTTSTHL